MKKIILIISLIAINFFPAHTQSIIRFGAGGGFNISIYPSQFSVDLPLAAFIEYSPSIDSYFKYCLKQGYISSSTPKNSGKYSEGTTKHLFTGLEASYLLDSHVNFNIGAGINYNYFSRELSSEAAKIFSDRGLDGKESFERGFGLELFFNFEPFKTKKSPISLMLEGTGNMVFTNFRTSVTDKSTGKSSEKSSDLKIYYFNVIIYLIFDFSKI